MKSLNALAGIRAGAILLITILITLTLLPFPIPSKAKASTPYYKELFQTDRVKSSGIRQKLARLPLSFEENLGQADHKVKFISRCDRYTLFLTATESVMMLTGAEQNNNDRLLTTTFKMKFVGANTAAHVKGIDELRGKSNYLIGNDSKKWRTNIHTYSKILCEQIYNGIDVAYYGNQRNPEYDLIVAPGADFTAVRVAFEGAKRIRADSKGDLLVEVGKGNVRQACPIAYQETVTGRRSVEAQYVIAGNNEIRFSLGEYDKSLPLIIDPVLSYSSFLGGAGSDIGSDIAVDSSGNIYVAGQTASNNFPVTPGAFQTVRNRFDTDTFITKLDPTGTDVIYSTYLGGNKYDAATSIAVSSEGEAYIAGLTGSADFPTTPGAFQTSFNGNPFIRAVETSNVGDAFVSRINASGSKLIYSTYLGSKGDDAAFDISIDSSGNAYITGKTDSIYFPVTEKAFQSFNAGSAAYRSQDSGSNWNSIKNGLSSAEVSALALDPQSPSIIYAASNATSFPDDLAASIFKSTDRGASWRKLSIETVDMINALAVDPKRSNIVYAGTRQGVYKSTNGGEQWVRLAGTFPGPVSAIVIDPGKPKRIYIGTGMESLFTGFHGGSLFRSTDGGATWKPNTLNDLPIIFFGKIFSLAVNPRDTAKLYAGTSIGVLRTLNSGRVWRETELNINIKAVAVDPSNPAIVYAAGSQLQNFGDGIYKSVDGGRNWEQLDTGFTGLSITSIALNPRNPSTIYAGLRRSDNLRSGVLKSTDSGAHWNLIGLGDVSVNALVVDPWSPANIYAGTFSDSDIFISKINAEGSALIYSTYLGGKGREIGDALATDASGRVCVTGETLSADFPSLNAFQSAKAGDSLNTDSFVTMLNASGDGLIYSSYLGGTGNDFGIAIAIDKQGAAYLTGMTDSTTFPTVNSFQGVYGGEIFDAFVVKISPP